MVFGFWVLGFGFWVLGKCLRLGFGYGFLRIGLRVWVFALWFGCWGMEPPARGAPVPRRYSPVRDDQSDFTQSSPLQGDISPHVQWTPVLLSEALLADDVYVCLERPSGVLPPQGLGRGYGTSRAWRSRTARQSRPSVL